MLTANQCLDAGVKNIHAYSWLAHARKYLESIAREKTHLVNRKKFGSRASGNWDHHSHLADHADGCRPAALLCSADYPTLTAAAHVHLKHSSVQPLPYNIHTLVCPIRVSPDFLLVWASIYADTLFNTASCTACSTECCTTGAPCTNLKACFRPVAV